MNVVARDVFDAFGVVVEGGDDGEDGGAGFSDGGHVAQVDEVEWGLADAEDEAAALFEANVGGALDEVLGEAVGDAAEGAHGAGKDDHGRDGIRTGGDGGADILVGEEGDPVRGVADEFFHETGTARDAGFFGQDAERAGRDDEVDTVDAGVVFKRAEHLDGEYRTAGAGDRENDVRRWGGFGGGGSCGTGVGYGGHQLRLCSSFCDFPEDIRQWSLLHMKLAVHFPGASTHLNPKYSARLREGER